MRQINEAIEDKTCPKCKKVASRTRTRRSFWVKYLLFWLPFKRYKCDRCGKKTYVFGSYTGKRTAFI